jgi:hypothetical protein
VEHVTQARIPKVDELRSNALAVHVRNAQHRVIETVPVVALRRLMLRVGALASPHLGADAVDGARVDFVAIAMQLLEQTMELIRQVLRPQLFRNPCM